MSTKPQPLSRIELISGFGQWHSPNNEKDPRPYLITTLAQIVEMAAAPPSVAKERAQWVIFSTLFSRVHTEQRENGSFYALWADIDETDGLSFEDMTGRAKSILPGFVAYTSRSATRERQKARLIVPLAHPVSGADFVLMQKVLNDKLQAVRITPDRATERAGQLCYLPNKGEFYRFAKVKAAPLELSAWAEDMEREQQRQRADQQAQMARREQARVKAVQRAASGGQSPIDAYNASVDLLPLAESYGYIQKGKRLLSPNSKSGVPGVTITGDGQKLLSTHESDTGIGTATTNGTMADAFDLFRHYEHAGDIDQAVKAAAAMFNCIRTDRADNPALQNNEKPEACEELILDPSDPYATAQIFINKKYSTQTIRLLQFWQGLFYCWHGSHYAQLERDDIRADLYKFLETAKVKDKNGLSPFKPNRNKISDAEDALRAAANLPGHHCPPCWLDAKKKLGAGDFVALSNGLLHLPTRQLHEPDPTFFTTTSLPFNYIPNAPEPKTWNGFLHSLWPDDEQTRKTLQEIFGLLLTSDTTQQKIFLIVGPMRSGKGTIARVLTAVLGADSVTGPTLSSLSSQFGLAPFIGKKLAIISDARLGSRADQNAITERLLSVSGEDSLSIPRKFLPDYTAKLDTRFMILTNELPRLADASGALASRFVVLTMRKSFLGKEDPGLTAKLLNELPAILNWSIKGWERLRDRGYFIQPASAKEAIQELADLSSPIGAFIRSRCVLNPAAEVECGTLYSEWRTWCVEQGREHPGTQQTFGRDLRAAAQIAVTQPRRGEERIRMYSGIGILESWHAVERVSDHCTRGEKEDYIYSRDDNAIARVPSRATLLEEKKQVQWGEI
jgi:putative DNA primase/helicase